MSPLPAPLRSWLASRPHSMQPPATPRRIERRVMIDDIQQAVARHFDLTIMALKGERRTIAIARPRQIGMYLAQRLTGRSLPEIGRKFGNRDHTTVLHAVRRITGLRDSDPEIDIAVRALMRRLKRRVG